MIIGSRKRCRHCGGSVGCVTYGFGCCSNECANELFGKGKPKMNIVYTQEEAPKTLEKSIFLVGPTPRDSETPSWRPAFLSLLKHFGYNGTVFVPEFEGDWRPTDYTDQIEWEHKHLEMADLLVAWVPRNLDNMPSFTTNIEFGMYARSGKLIYGRPNDAPKNRYLDACYLKFTGDAPKEDMTKLAAQAAERLSIGAKRTEGERKVPLHIWNTRMFQDWYAMQKLADNRLDDAKVLWTHVTSKKNLFCYTLWVNVWVAAEQRHKSNEFILSRPDISTVIPYWQHPTNPIHSKVVLIREFRSPIRSRAGFVYELPGGSSFKPDKNPFQCAVDELKEETGIDVGIDRVESFGTRQVVSTLSTHNAHVFSIDLSDKEIKSIEKRAAEGKAHGVEGDSERTYIEVRTVKSIMSKRDVDWSMMGMIMGLVNERA